MFLEIVTGSLLGTAILVFLFLFIRKWIENLTKNYFDKNIENHKHELTKTLKEVEFDYQRKIEDHALFTKKRHDIYAELYKLLNTSVDTMLFATEEYKVYPIPNIMNFEDNFEIERFLINEGFVEGDIGTVLTYIDESDLTNAYNLLYILYDKKRLHEASDNKREAYNYFSRHELYIKETLSNKINHFFKVLNGMYQIEDTRIVYAVRQMSLEKFENKNEENEENRNMIVTLLSEIREEMRKELSIGDYAEKSS